MQPEPYDSSTRIVTEPSPSDLSQSSQYGFLPEHLQSAGQPESIEQPGDGSSESIDDASSVNSTSNVDAETQARLQRLNINDTELYRGKASFQRIAEYENALSSTPARSQNSGPGFKVVGKGEGSLNGPHLNSFPNEVLTHILSHLPAASLSLVSLVSHRFYHLVTTPHAWRVAFSRFFPGPGVVGSLKHESIVEVKKEPQSEKRDFTRLTGLATWRSEYILRTRLLRSLARGKPVQIAPGHGASSRTNSAANNVNAVVTYSSQLFSTVNHIHGVFDGGKKSPRFIHGTDETGSACTSDPNIGKIDNWGLADPQALPQFVDLFVGDAPFGEGDGPTGLPNCMDLSQPFGMIHGEGFPGGQVYFRSSEEQRGRFLSQISDSSDYRYGIPKIPGFVEAISSVWIAKSNAVPNMTNGLIGMLTGSTLGMIVAYSLGADSPVGRIARGQLTAKWVISPGVPIVNIQVDDCYNLRRKDSNRIWAVAVNALGEVFYLQNVPTPGRYALRSEENDFALPWIIGRTAYWSLLETSHRVAREDPYNESNTHGSYSPRPSPEESHLSAAQVAAETAEIEKFLNYRPSHFRRVCEGWDMHRRMEVDFAGDDGKGAGETIVVVRCGVRDGEQAEIRRFTRWMSEQASLEEYPIPKTPPMSPSVPTMASLFGGGSVISPPRSMSPEQQLSATCPSPLAFTPVNPIQRGLSDAPSSPERASMIRLGKLVEEWRTSILSLKDIANSEITATAIDTSMFALLTVNEDPLCSVSGVSNLSSPFSSPTLEPDAPSSYIPGHRARFLAIGTKTGAVAIYNVRGAQSANAVLVNELKPIRVITTDSPQISCLAMSALYIVIGGNDGLVQAWDPLASNLQPIRTLNSRFSSRARRRLVQAEASILGVGINLYAAGAIILDPDPTVLRGMVSLGTHLRYWSYSSSAADQYHSRKRRLRRSGERGGNSGPDRFTNTGRGALMDYIATEQEELKKEKLRRSKEEARLRGRFGLGLGLSDEEALKYAEMVSAEAFKKDEARRMSGLSVQINTSNIGEGQILSDNNMAPNHGSSRTAHVSSPPNLKIEDEFEEDIEEAIRLSLLDGLDESGSPPRASGSGMYDIPLKYKSRKLRRSTSSSPSSSKASRNRAMLANVSARDAASAEDLEFALLLSMAEEQSKREVWAGGEEFPRLESPDATGKGKERAK